jgi:hypothetical protein
MNQKQKVLNYLEAGNDLTVAHANRHGIANVGEVVRKLREEGNCIYLNKRANGNSFYRLGNPTKKMVATAFAVAGAAAFN